MARKLPPLNAIRAFEASARRGGFVAAAEELGVSAAAISLQVRKLEAFYEAQLFRRLSSGVELTDIGAAIHVECVEALARLEATNDLVHASEMQSRLVISCINSIAHRWIAPRLGLFRDADIEHWIELRSEADPVDFDEGRVDLRITYGAHLYPHHDNQPLFTDVLMPLCTPDFAERSGIVPGDPSSLRDEHLIETWWSPSFWAYPGWTDWFAKAGRGRTPRPGVGQGVNMPSLAVDAAIAGIGVALAQWSLAETEVREGRLVRPFDTVLPMPNPYSIVMPRSSRRRRRVKAVLAFLKEQAAGTERGLSDPSQA
jgi:LysR family glycine cleavage system transcriptional activator